MIAALIARLKTVPGLRLVDGLAEWSVLDAPPLLTPAAYVLPGTTDAQPNGVAAGGFRQALRETAQILLLARNLRDPNGAAATQDLAAIRDAVRASVLGWVPVLGWQPLELVSGSLVGIEGDCVVWRDLVASEQQFFRV